MSERTVGTCRGAAAGPTLVVTAGVHGNEPAGLEAGRRVLDRLAPTSLRGELVVLKGNVAALATGARYLDRDLNRSFTAAHVDRVHGLVDRRDEDREVHELLAAFDAIDARARGTVHLADLHTSSAPGVPFVLFGARPAQRSFVRAFPIPVIGGIVEQVDGVLSEHAGARGWTTFSVEGGQHDDPVSAVSLEAVIWLSLVKAGMIDDGHVAGPYDLLNALRGDLPRAVQVVSRHAITPVDEFVMEQGFRNVERVVKGQLLARSRTGDVRAVEDGVVVLPLYQKLGADGFFWGREP